MDADCVPSTPCASGSCQQGTCIAIPLSGVPCDDRDACTVGDTCQNGLCMAGSGLLDGDGDSFPGILCGGTDCNDGNGAVYPGAEENCMDGQDNDCNMLVDGDDPACQSTGGGDDTPCSAHADCGEGLLCAYRPAYGNTRCSTLCASAAECGAGEICAHLPGSANIGYCRISIATGNGALGSACGVGGDCASEICSSGVCSGLCGDEDACPGASTCFPGGSLDTGFNGVCAPDSTFPGGKGNGQSCLPSGSGVCLSGHCDVIGSNACAPICGTDTDCGFTPGMWADSSVECSDCGIGTLRPVRILGFHV